MRIYTAAYRLTLRLYPASFRKAYGSEMAQLFADMLADQRRTGSRLNIFRLWAHLIADTVANATKERLGPLKNRTALIRFLLAVSFVVSVAVTMFTGAVLLVVIPAALFIFFTTRVKLFRDAVFEREQRRWWLWPAIGLVIIGSSVGLVALPGLDSLDWSLLFLGGIGGAVVVAASIGRTLMLMIQRPSTPVAQ
jgi:hypothetical protein